MLLLSSASPAFELSPLIRLVQAPKNSPELSHFHSQSDMNSNNFKQQQYSSQPTADNQETITG